MREFDYHKLPDELLTEDVMSLLSMVHEHKGRQELPLCTQPDMLEALTDVAKVQSAEASNRIEGIRTSEKRLQQIMEDTTDLRSRDEEEIAGYRDVLDTIHRHHDSIAVTPSILLQLHRDLYRHTASSMGGRFKVGDNEIRGTRTDGTEYIRFRTVPAVSTPYAVEALCNELNYALANESMDPLLASLLFVFDFTCIHPFNDGNGRMSRLLTLLLLYRAGYVVGKYISIEKEIERTKDTYYNALAASSAGWDSNKNNPEPFVRYMLGVILAAYRDFEERVTLVLQAKTTKPERIATFMRNHFGPVRKADILAALPDISETTVERTLSSLLKAGNIRKVGGGRATAYVWKEPFGG